MQLTSALLPDGSFLDVAPLGDGDSDPEVDAGLLGQGRQENSAEAFGRGRDERADLGATSRRDLGLYVPSCAQARAQAHRGGAYGRFPALSGGSDLLKRSH